MRTRLILIFTLLVSAVILGSLVWRQVNDAGPPENNTGAANTGRCQNILKGLERSG